MDGNQTTYELKSGLARYCLPSQSPDTNLKLAWVNSICILFLIIGIVGARRGIITIRTVPPIRQAVPVVVMPQRLPPQLVVPQKREQPQQSQPARVYVALPSAPNISFSVPTIGTLVASADMASAPPLKPLQAPAQIASLGNTGAGGERPEPPYPQLAMQTGEQGTIVLLLTGDASGNVVSIDVKQSSGFPYLDQTTVGFIKTHWHLPTESGTRLFQTTITFKLQ
ncbi:MAG TPA: TonB family protein [Candidatus Sulfotelmatobacter sp.]|nr:TonB family protein [Candidatus Sulfotelmatobacter sp.]